MSDKKRESLQVLENNVNFIIDMERGKKKIHREIKGLHIAFYSYRYSTSIMQWCAINGITMPRYGHGIVATFEQLV